VRESRRKMDKAYYGIFDSSLGVIYIASTEKGVCKIALPRGRRGGLLWMAEKPL